jgi:hypothetical protein
VSGFTRCCRKDGMSRTSCNTYKACKSGFNDFTEYKQFRVFFAFDPRQNYREHCRGTKRSRSPRTCSDICSW